LRFEEQRLMLQGLVAGSRTAAQREVERARILLAYAGGQSPTEIHRLVGVSWPTIYKCIDKSLAAGVSVGCVIVIIVRMRRKSTMRPRSG
jgi:transposase